MQDQVYYRRRRYEDAASEALRAVEIYEKVGALGEVDEELSCGMSTKSDRLGYSATNSKTCRTRRWDGKEGGDAGLWRAGMQEGCEDNTRGVVLCWEAARRVEKATSKLEI